MSKWPKIRIVSPWGRLVLVPPGPEDDILVAASRSDPETIRHLPFMPKSMSPDEWRVKREQISVSDDAWDFHIHYASPENQDAQSSPYVGQCIINHIDIPNRSGEIGIIVPSGAHRRGIATEALYVTLLHAFEYPDLKLHRVQFVTSITNIQMRGWLESFGIAEEHRLREAWSDGQGGRLDAVGYSIIRSEWPPLKERLERRLTARAARTSEGLILNS